MEQGKTALSNRRQAAVCPTSTLARALPLNTLEANPTGPSRAISSPVHWDSMVLSPGFSPNLPRTDRRLRLVPRQKNQSHRQYRYLSCFNIANSASYAYRPLYNFFCYPTCPLIPAPTPSASGPGHRPLRLASRKRISLLVALLLLAPAFSRKRVEKFASPRAPRFPPATETLAIACHPLRNHGANQTSSRTP